MHTPSWLQTLVSSQYKFLQQNRQYIYMLLPVMIAVLSRLKLQELEKLLHNQIYIQMFRAAISDLI